MDTCMLMLPSLAVDVCFTGCLRSYDLHTLLILGQLCHVHWNVLREEGEVGEGRRRDEGRE